MVFLLTLGRKATMLSGSLAGLKLLMELTVSWLREWRVRWFSVS
jgi:hypothetical protein